MRAAFFQLQQFSIKKFKIFLFTISQPILKLAIGCVATAKKWTQFPALKQCIAPSATQLVFLSGLCKLKRRERVTPYAVEKGHWACACVPFRRKRFTVFLREPPERQLSELSEWTALSSSLVSLLQLNTQLFPSHSRSRHLFHVLLVFYFYFLHKHVIVQLLYYYKHFHLRCLTNQLCPQNVSVQACTTTNTRSSPTVSPCCF